MTRNIADTSIKHFVDIPRIGIFDKKEMSKNTSILLGDYFDNFINCQVKTGRYSSASEVVRAALRMFEYEETKKAKLVGELESGEKSGFVKDFDRNSFLKNIREKQIANES